MKLLQAIRLLTYLGAISVVTFALSGCGGECSSGGTNGEGSSTTESSSVPSASLARFTTFQSAIRDTIRNFYGKYVS
jgi:hypothetical protein